MTIEPNFTLGFFVLHLFMASNWFTMEPSFNGPVWSVSIEVLIYFVFLLYMRRVGLNLLVALALAGVGFVIETATDSYLAMCLSLFFGGVTMAILLPHAQAAFGKRLLPLMSLAVCGVIAVSLGLALIGRGNLVHTFLIYFGTPALLGLFVALDVSGRTLSHRWQWVGAITYAVYLLHMPVIIALKVFWPGVVDYLPSWQMLAAYCLLVIALAVPVHYLFELRVQRWIRLRGSAWLSKSPVSQQSRTSSP